MNLKLKSITPRVTALSAAGMIACAGLMVPAVAQADDSTNPLATVLEGTGLAGNTAESATQCVESGSLSWAFKDSFLSYIQSGIALGTVSAVSPATTEGDGDTVTSITYPAATGQEVADPSSTVTFRGGVNYYAHLGILNITVSNIRLNLTEDSTAATLVADITSGSNTYPDATVADIVLATAPDFTADSIDLASTKVTLDAEAENAFQNYSAGTELAPTSGALTLGDDCTSTDTDTDGTTLTDAVTNQGSSVGDFFTTLRDFFTSLGDFDDDSSSSDSVIQLLPSLPILPAGDNTETTTATATSTPTTTTTEASGSGSGSTATTSATATASISAVATTSGSSKTSSSKTSSSTTAASSQSSGSSTLAKTGTNQRLVAALGFAALAALAAGVFSVHRRARG